jgi:hypothetical protein
MTNNVLMADLRWQFSKRGELYFDGSYTQSEASYQSLSVYAQEQDVIDAFFPSGELPGPGADAGSPLHFSDFDFSDVNQYSDLDYVELRSRVGANYLVHSGIRLFASISYADVDDNAPYLQDLAGTVWLGRLGAVWSF